MKIRFLSLAVLFAAQGAFAQNLPAPAEVIPSTPVRATQNATPKPQAPPSQAPPPVIIITDDPVPARQSNPGDWMSLPPVRSGQPDGAPDTSPAAPHAAAVGGISVYGLTDLAALEKLKSAFDARLKTEVTLSDDTRNWTLSRAALGVTIPYRTLLDQARTEKQNVPLRFALDTTTALGVIEKLAAKVNRTEAHASGNTGHVRVKMAVEGSLLRVKDAIEAQPSRLAINLVVTRTATAAPKAVPTATPGKAGAPKGFPYLLAEYSSVYYAGPRGRTNNLRMAAKLVNGTVVPAGGIFSTNKSIGPRNAAAGWKEAKMFVSGQVVDGVGAGICQCSSTIYNAALLAGLPIVERHPHTFRVTYVPPSRDAAIYWGSKDMRFRNNTGGAIYVETFLRGGSFHARLWGTQPKQGTYLVESRTISRKSGTTSEAYRIVKTSGGTERQRLSRDHYRPKPE